MEFLVDTGYGLVGFLLLISIIVFIHEYGHYFAARLCNVKIERFSMGFGKVLWSKKDKNGCEWSLSLIPLGGYVKFAGDRNAASQSDLELLQSASEEDKKQLFHFKNLWQKLFIVIAGPLANVLLCLFLLWGVYFVHGFMEVVPRIMDVKIESAADKAGLKVGDLIIAVEGEKIESIHALQTHIFNQYGQSVSIDIERGGKILKKEITPIIAENFHGEKIPVIGASFYNVPIIGRLIKGMPAEKSGLKQGDKILKVGGKEVKQPQDIIQEINKSESLKPITLTIIRDVHDLHSVTIMPQMKTYQGQERKMIGIEFRRPEFTLSQYQFLNSMKASFEKTQEMIVMTIHFFKNLVTGYMSIEQLSGPVKIGSVAGDALQNISIQKAPDNGSSHITGIAELFMLIAFISLNIGIVNLLPIPTLDGGHIIFYLFELVTGVRPHKDVQKYAFKIGFFFIITLMLFTIANDLGMLKFL